MNTLMNLISSRRNNQLAAILGTLKIGNPENDQKEGFSPATATLATATVEGCIWDDTKPCIYCYLLKLMKNGGVELVDEQAAIVDSKKNTVIQHGTRTDLNPVGNRFDLVRT